MIMPGSHLSGRHPTAEEGANSGIHLGAIPLEGKAGTLVIYDARLWHQAGLNRGTKVDPILREPWRLCIFCPFSAPQMRQQANLSLTTHRNIVATASDHG